MAAKVEAKKTGSQKNLIASPTNARPVGGLGIGGHTKWNLKVKAAKGERTVDLVLDRTLPLNIQVKKLVPQLYPDAADPTFFALQRVASQKYIIQEDLDDEKTHMPDGELCTLIDQSAEAETVVVTLNALAKQVEEKKIAEMLKKHVFHLQDHMKVDVFGEEFIVQGGMESLLTVINVGGSTSAAYALKALSSALLYMNGLEYIKNNNLVLEKIVSLVYNSSNIRIVRHAFAMAFVIAQFIDEGYSLVHRAIKKTDRARDNKPYQQVVNSLLMGDLDVKVNALTLINVLLKKTPNKRKLKKLITRLEEVQLFAALERQEDIGDPDFLTQLEIFREISGANIAPTRVEVNVLRGKLSHVQLELEKAERTLHDYRRHQALVEILRQELMRYRRAVCEAYEAGVLVNGYAPMVRFKTSEKNKKDFGQHLVDLTDLAKEEKGRAEFRAAAENAERAQKLEIEKTDLTKKLNNVSKQVERLTEELKKAKEMKGGGGGGGGGYGDVPGAPPGFKDDGGDGGDDTGHPKTKEDLIKENHMLKKYLRAWQSDYEGLKKQLEDMGIQPLPATVPPAAIAAAEEAELLSPLPREEEPAMEGAPDAPPIDGDVPDAPELGRQPTKPVIKPKKPMKKLHWKRIILPREGLETVWKTLNDPVDFNVSEFEDEFSQKTFSKDKETKDWRQTESETRSGGGFEFKKKQKTRVLTDKRSQNVAIMMSSLPPLNSLREAIVTMNLDLLPEEKINKLRRELPTAEEVKLVREIADQDPDNLDKPEQLFLMLSDIPFLSERLNCWSFSLHFVQHARELNQTLEIINDAAKDLRSNKSLRLALAAIVGFGNYMNGGTPKGQADGFEIDFLVRIIDTKNVSNSTNLLEFVARHMKETDAATLQIKDELKAVYQAATKSHLHDVLNESRRLENTYTIMKKGAEQVYSAPCGGSDEFHSRMTEFFSTGEDIIGALKSNIDKAQKSYAKCHSYFGDASEEKERPSGEFFEIFTRFLDDLNKSFPKDKATTTALTRKHKLGQKLGAGDNKAGGMGSIIAHIKSGGRKETKKSKVGRESVLPMDNDLDGLPPPPVIGGEFGSLSGMAAIDLGGDDMGLPPPPEDDYSPPQPKQSLSTLSRLPASSTASTAGFKRPAKFTQSR